MTTANVFKRYEMKYLISREQYDDLKDIIALHMNADEHGETTIRNIYYDTDFNEVISRSVEKPMYKEKLRVRSYSQAGKDSKVFVELKKKFQGIVYKRRISMTNKQMKEFMVKDWDNSSQIASEIKYYQSRFDSLKPAMFIAYDREAFFGKDNGNFRLTLDQNIIYRDYDLDLGQKVYGEKLLDDNQILVEVKTESGIPLWLREFFDQNGIYKISFSKYGRIYQRVNQNNNEYLNNYMLNRRREFNYAKYF